MSEMIVIGDKTYLQRMPSKYKYAIIRHRPEGRSGDAPFRPDIIPMQNPRESGVPGPADSGEGDLIPVLSAVWKYMELPKVNPHPKGYKYTREKNALWINDTTWDNVTPYSQGLAVSHICAGNFVAYDDETPTHVRLVCYDGQMDMINILDPDKDNWFQKPWLWWKAIAINENGTLINVGDDIDAYFPLIRKKDSELWMYKKHLELFPVGPDYRFYGCNIYNGNQPLMTVASDRTRTFHTSWKIETIGVIPPS